MVGLADIPCVGKFVDRVSDYAVDAVFRGLKYMFCYKSLVEELKAETEKLNAEEEEMSRKVKKEEENGKIIKERVLKWQIDAKEIQKSAEEIQKSAEEISASCSCIPNPVSRFRLGRNAAKKAKAVAELTGKDYVGGEIAQLPRDQNMPNSVTTFEEFQSRKDIYKKFWDALVNEDSPLIHGIYGMAGVGKTRMMEKIWEDAMKEEKFNKVVRVNVGSENLDIVNLQDQIAGPLKCKLESQDVESRASQLKNSLRNRKILLILDDVWREIHLDKIIGTPFGDGSSSSKGSKILFTSREKEVCLDNKCEHLVEIETLKPGEALDLFKKAVGPGTINDLQDESLVQNVCDECGHLPLLIHAVGNALKGKSRILWTDAHKQLKEGKFQKIAGVKPKVYTGIKLSIDYLQNDDAKSCLFLCSMFPEDANIDMKMLIQLATGSQLIPDGEVRILAMVDSLKASSLLLDSGEDGEIKVHDIIRDVARSIASTDSKYAFLHVTCNSGYFPYDASDCTGKFLRLDAETDDVHFEELKVCPDLHTLWLQCNNHPQQFSGGFFSMFANLSCLMLQNVNISVEQFSLQPLVNLGTLSLLKCDIRKTDVSLYPKKLKTLCICKCKLPRPLDVADLKYLRKLEIQQRGPVLVMLNAISSLSSLEELHISNGFIINDRGEYDLETIVMEISKLTLLKSLHFEFYEDEDNTFQGTDIFSNIDRYNLFVGTPKPSAPWGLDWRVPLTRSIEFNGNHSKSWEGLMARAEQVELRYSDVEVSSICNGHTRAFQDLKRLSIIGCKKMGHLSIIQSPACFSKLTILKISFCSKLKYLFCNNNAKSLVQLQQLRVERCESMEAIIMNEGTSDGEIINFSKLKSLTISDTPRLTGFYAENSGFLSAQYQPLFDGKVAFPSLEALDIFLLKTSVIWGKDCFIDTVSSFCKLKRLCVGTCDELEILIPMLPRVNNLESIHVRHCNRLRSMFPPCVASNLKHLKEMDVKDCGEMREIIEAGEQVITDDDVLFPQLTVLELHKGSTCKIPLRLPQLSSIVLEDLPHLKSFFHGANFEFHMPALKNVIVDRCRLSTLFTFSMFRKFQLETLDVRNCEFLVNIVEDLRGDETCDKIITLSQLTKVYLINLPNLKRFFHNANYEFHMPALKEVLVDSCGLSSLFMLSVFRKLQLEKLKVGNCELLENIVEDLRGDETCDKIITLSQLTTVILEKLPYLKRFFHNANYEFHMPALKEVKVCVCGLSNTLFTRSAFKNLKQLQNLSVYDCELLEGIFEDARGDETLDTSDKIITLSRVSEVHLQGLPKFKSIFYGETYECYMPALKNVKIVGCGLSILFTCSVFREIRLLEGLYVSNCGSLEHIVKEVEGDETSGINGKSITSSQLSSISLDSLPNLKSFSCAESYVFNMPNLKEFWLKECPRIEYFSSSKTNTPSVHVYSNWDDAGTFTDVNDYIRQITKEEATEVTLM